MIRMIWIMMILLAVLVLTGCSTFREMPVYEKAWHAMNVIDAGQTIHIAREPSCYREVGFPTQALIGSHPSETEVYLTMAAFGLAYHYTSRWLDRKIASKPSGTQAQGNWIIGRGIFQGVLLVGKGATILNNADIELTPWGTGCP